MKVETDSGVVRGRCEKCGTWVDPDELQPVSFGSRSHRTVVRRDRDEWSYTRGELDRLLSEADWLRIFETDGVEDSDGELYTSGLRAPNTWFVDMNVPVRVVRTTFTDGDVEWCEACCSGAEREARRIRREVGGV